ncbi:MAG: CotH kinase family protein [Oscillospiraceae bacterium]|nr:CotH kinase family protein [Oscillospiraceae bacterium]
MQKYKKTGKIISAILALAIFLPGQAAFAQEPGKQNIKKGDLIITELMVKNHATRLNAAGDIADYIEITNLSEDVLELEGFGLSDDKDEIKWSFPARKLMPGEQLVILADKDKKSEGQLNCGFGLSLGETVYLTNDKGRIIHKADGDCDTADVALVMNEEENWEESVYPSPGFSNDKEGYIHWQGTLETSSPLVINEAMTSNSSYVKQYSLGYCDWVELKNVSDEPVQLSDYYLSDDDDYLTQWRLPAGILYPGEMKVIMCDDSDGYPDSNYLKAPFKLGSDRERVYLSHAGTGLADSVFLRDIPHNRSFGRVSGENGFFFFEIPSPGMENGRGGRMVSSTPVALTRDGIFEEGGVRVELEAAGEIYYTTDGGLPTAKSSRYTGPFTVDASCVVRAVSFEKDAVSSRALTLSYIIGEGHSMPVLSLATDYPSEFWFMYSAKRKDIEVPGSISFYEDGDSFTVGCGIGMHGEASLLMPKKSMSVKFSTAYGQETLEYDIFGGGVTEFSNLVLRAGLDSNRNIPRNELLESLCLQFSDKVPTQRGRHCVLYINGDYQGVYVLTEKTNEQHYANLMGVTRESVIDNKVMVSPDKPFYKEVIDFVRKNNISSDEGYEEFSQIMDIDNIIDWMIIQGYSGNNDIADSNIRFCRSSEGDGKWRIVLFDMDSTMIDPRQSFKNVLRPGSNPCAVFIVPLMQNAQFRERFLSRTAEALETTLSDENVVNELLRLKEIMRPEVPRDYMRYGLDAGHWEWEYDRLCEDILTKRWSSICAQTLSNYLVLSEAEREHYFGNLLY